MDKKEILELLNSLRNLEIKLVDGEYYLENDEEEYYPITTEEIYNLYLISYK